MRQASPEKMQSDCDGPLQTRNNNNNNNNNNIFCPRYKWFLEIHKIEPNKPGGAVGVWWVLLCALHTTVRVAWLGWGCTVSLARNVWVDTLGTASLTMLSGDLFSEPRSIRHPHSKPHHTLPLLSTPTTPHQLSSRPIFSKSTNE